MHSRRCQVSQLCLLLLLLLTLLFHIYTRPDPVTVHHHHLLAQPVTSSSSPRCNSTLVTAYYKIRSKHSHAKYTRWMTNFLSLPDCLVVFVQPGLEDLVKALRPASLPTLVIPRPLTSFLVHDLTDETGWDKQEQKDHELAVGHSRLLYWIWNEKTHLMKIAADLNTFSSSYFVWLDIGAVREESNNHKKLLNIVPPEPGILLLAMEPFTEEELQAGSEANFQHVNRIGGGTIGADRKSLEIWHNAYYAQISSMIKEERFVGKDQSVMAATCLANPGLCLLVKSNGNWFYLQEVLRGDTSLAYNKLKGAS